MTSLRDFARILREGVLTSKNTLIVGHGECGDGYGSVIALSEVFTIWNITHAMFLPGDERSFGSALFDMSNVVFNPNDIDLSAYDCIVLVDTADTNLTGMGQRLNRCISEKNARVFMLDHHGCNTGYGHCFYVDGTAPANVCLIYELLLLWNIGITPKIADALLLGLFFDTGILHHDNTNGECLRLASVFRSCGARYGLIVDLLNSDTKPIEAYRLLAKGLRIAWTDEDGLLTVPISTEPVSKDIAESLGGFSNTLNRHLRYSDSLKGVCVLRGDKVDADGKPFVTGSLRTTRKDLNVAEIAKRHGGGGHVKAAGFRKDGILKIQNCSWSAD